MADLRRHAKFGKNRSKRAPETAIFRFSKMAAAAILDFQNFKFLTVGQLKRVERRCPAKFGEIDRNAAEIWRFFHFPRWPLPPSWIFKFLKFRLWNAQDGRTASQRLSWSKSVELRPRYGDFSIFQAGRLRHVGFLNF